MGKKLYSVHLPSFVNMKFKEVLSWCFLFLVLLLGFTAVSVAYLKPSYLLDLLEISPDRVSSAISKISPPMRLDSVKHGIFGFLLGLLTLEPGYVLFSVFTSVLIDLDHAPFLLGLSVPARISHSLIFLSLADIGYLLFFRKKELVFVFTSSFLLHMALDKLNIPFLSPFMLSPQLPHWLRPIFVLLSFSLNLLVGRSRLREVMRVLHFRV